MTGTCASAMMGGFETGLICLLGVDDDECHSCLQDGMTEPDGPAPKCWKEDCDIMTMSCLAIECDGSEKQCEKAAIACMRLADTSDSCGDCLDKFEKKSSAAALSIFAAVITTVLALL